VFSFYLILGVEENASDQAIEAAYRRLRSELVLGRFEPESLGYIQCEQCLLSIENAHKTLTSPQLKSRYYEQWRGYLKEEAAGGAAPKLGQLCVASGMITLEELERAVETQTRMDLPLGQILQESKLISQAELDGLLLGQKLIQLPVGSPHSIGQRLMALGLVSEDMVRIALIEQRTFDRKLEDLLVSHGWLDQTVLAILIGNGRKPAESKNSRGRKSKASK